MKCLFTLALLVGMTLSSQLFALNSNVVWKDQTGKLQFWNSETSARTTLATNAVEVVGADGNLAWLDSSKKIKFWNRTTTTTIADFGNTPVTATYLQVSGNRVAYQFNEKIYLYEDGRTTLVYETPAGGKPLAGKIALSSKLLVFYIKADYHLNSIIKVFDGVQTYDLNTVTNTSKTRQLDVGVEGNTIVWGHYSSDGSKSWLDVWNGTTHQVIDSPSTSFFNPVISNGSIAMLGSNRYSGALSSDVFIRHPNGLNVQKTRSSGLLSNLQFDGETLAWNSVSGTTGGIFGIAPGGFATELSTNPNDTLVKVGSGYVIWSAKTGGTDEVFAWNGATTTRLTNNAIQDTAVAALSTSTAGKCELVDGQIYAFKNVNSGLHIEIEARSTEDFANFIQFSTDSQYPQRHFIAKSKGNGYFGLQNEHSGKYVDVAGRSLNNGANVQQSGTNANTYNRQFSLAQGPNGACQIKARHSTKCITVSGGSTNPGANINQWACNGNAAQEWILIPQ